MSLPLSTSHLSPGSRVLVAVSGGADSLALLHALASQREELEVEILAAHIHHGMRGDDADADADYLADLCARLEVPLEVVRRDVPALAAGWRVSVEEAGRIARYEALGEVAQRRGCALVATAHHADDHAETILMNLMRGASLAGLSGIPAYRPLSAERPEVLLIRPLLHLRREDLVAYCAEHGLSARHDRTNDDLAYRRNRIRHQVMPVLLAEEPRLVEKLERLSRHAAEAEQLLDLLAATLGMECEVRRADGGFLLRQEPLVTAPSPVVRRLLRDLALRLGCPGDRLDAATMDRILFQVTQGHGGPPLTLPGGAYTLQWVDDSLVLAPRQRIVPEPPHPITLEEEALSREVLSLAGFGLELAVEKGPAPPQLRLPLNESVIPWSAIRFPLQVRAPQVGDRFTPLGAPGSRLLSDLFVDRKVARERRATWPLLVDQEGILWVLGLAVSERCRAQPGQPDCLYLTSRASL